MNELINLFRQGKAIIFTGSGISFYAGYPQSKELAEIIIKKIPDNKRKSERTTLSEVAELYCKIYNRDNLIEILKPIFEKEPLSIEYHKFISEIPQIKKIITTNYDRTFEKAYGDNIQIVLSKEDLIHLNAEKTTLFKIHGSFEVPNSIIITKSDYEDFFTKNKSKDLLWNEVKSVCAKNAIVFIGYSLGDIDVRHILLDIIKQLGDHHKGLFLIAPKVEDYDVETFVKDFHIKYFDLSAESFISQLKEEIELHKTEDYHSKFITDDEFQKMLKRQGLSSQIHINDESAKSIRIESKQNNGLIFAKILSKNKESEAIQNISSILSGRCFTPISLDLTDKDIDIIARGIGILPPKLTITPQPVNSFKAVLKVKNTDIIFTDIIGETYGSYKMFSIQMNHPMFSVSFESSTESLQIANFKLKFEGSCCPVKDYLLYNMLNSWKSGNPLIIGIEDFPFTTEIPSEALNNNPELIENIEFNYSLLNDLLKIQDFFNCFFWNISDIDESNFNTISLLLKIVNGEDIQINSFSGIFSTKESQNLIKKLIEGIDGKMQFKGEQSIKIFNVTLVLDYEVEMQDPYITEPNRVQGEFEKGEEEIFIEVRSRQNIGQVKYKKSNKLKSSSFKKG